MVYLPSNPSKMKRSIILVAICLAAFFTINAQVKNKSFSKSDLLKMTGLIELSKAIDSTADYSKYTFRSFELSLNLKGVEITETTQGALFSEKQKKLISDASVGTKLFFENIRAIEPEKRDVITLPVVIVGIKE